MTDERGKERGNKSNNPMQGKSPEEIFEQEYLSKQKAAIDSVPPPPPKPTTEVKQRNQLPKEEKKMENIEISDRGIKYGVIGVGHAGNRLAEQFYKLGYAACAVNTAKQDLAFIDMPANNKLFLDFALGGVGKDATLGQQAIEHYEADIMKLMKDIFKDVDAIVITVGLGGGTGSLSASSLARMCKVFSLPVGIICTLPMSSEGTTTKSNAIKALDKLARLTKQDFINFLIIADNAKIEQMYPNAAASSFWTKANEDIVNTLHIFNMLSTKDTKYMALDPMDFARILSTGNCTIYGKMEVANYMQEAELATALTQNIENGLLVAGFNLHETIRAGVIITGSEAMLDKLPAVNINYAFSVLNELIGSAEVFRGIYAIPTDKPTLTVYSIFSGLGLPKERLETMIAESKEAMDEMKNKEADKSKMDILPDSQASKSDIYADIKQRNSAFGSIINRKKNRG